MKGNIWVSYYFYGIDKFKSTGNGKFEIVHYAYEYNDPSSISSNSIRSIYVSKNNVLWVGDDGYGINKTQLKEKFSVYRFNPLDSTSLRSKSIRAVYETPDGKLLVGGYSPLMTLDRTLGVLPVKCFNEDSKKWQEDIPYAVYCISPDPIFVDSIVWMGTEGYGLFRYNYVRHTFHQY